MLWACIILALLAIVARQVWFLLREKAQAMADAAKQTHSFADPVPREPFYPYNPAGLFK